MPTSAAAPVAVPGLRRNMVTICAMTATIMQALDTTIANVALPYMQGTLSASQDQINWVLTSYIVAAAIMTAPVGWIANRFGRKRIFILCSGGFTIASVLCGLAQDINQIALDRGEQLGWMESNEIIAEFIISIVGFYYFFAHSLTTSKPFIQFAIFKDKNFVGGCVFMAVMGLVLFSTMALSSPYLQNVIGYPIITAGLLLASRGCGTFVAMMLVGRLMRYIEARTLIVSGLSLTCLSLFYMTGWTDQTGVPEIVTWSIVQSFGFGLVFSPLSTVAFLTLPNHLRTDGTSMLTLMRNVHSSFRLSVVIAQLTEGSRRTYAILSQHVNPFNHALQMPDVRAMIDMSTDKGRAMMDVIVNLQAQIIAFSHDYQMVMIFTLCAIPLAVMIGSTKAALRKQSLAPEHAVIE